PVVHPASRARLSVVSRERVFMVFDPLQAAVSTGDTPGHWHGCERDRAPTVTLRRPRVPGSPGRPAPTGEPRDCGIHPGAEVLAARPELPRRAARRLRPAAPGHWISRPGPP